MQSQRRLGRLKIELEQLEKSPPPGVSCWLSSSSSEDRLDRLEANIVGPDDTPFKDGVFRLDIQIPDKYPMEPPNVTFLTKIYHCNVDNDGRICLSILKMPPKGDWKPTLNISTVLTSIRLLMSTPNPDDPLLADIAQEIRFQPAKYQHTAAEWTRRYACQTVPLAAPKRKASETSPERPSKMFK